MLVASSPRRHSPSPAPARRRAGRLDRSRRSSTCRRRKSLCRTLQYTRECREQRTSHCQASPAVTKAAYGELLAIHGVDNGNITTQASPLTSRGYSGEHFDATLQQQYLRARWYDPATGRFNRVDPFAGNMQAPQSLHKYAYVHGDPTNMTDPTGMFGLAGSIGAIGIAANVFVAELTVGVVTIAALETGGKAGFDARTAGLLLIANGELDAGFFFYNLGNRLIKATFEVIEAVDTGIGLAALGPTALIGAARLIRSAPETGKHC